MNEGNETKKSGLWSIAGMVVLIIVLFVGIKAVFAGLEAAIPQNKTDVSASQSQSVGAGQNQEEPGGLPAPGFCPFCGEALNDSFQWGQYCPFCGELVEP